MFFFIKSDLICNRCGSKNWGKIGFEGRGTLEGIKGLIILNSVILFKYLRETYHRPFHLPANAQSVRTPSGGIQHRAISGPRCCEGVVAAAGQDSVEQDGPISTLGAKPFHPRPRCEDGRYWGG